MKKIVLWKKEKKDLLDCIASLDADITKYSFEAEKKKDFTLLTKANAFRKSKTEKGERRNQLQLLIALGIIILVFCFLVF